MKYKLRFFAIVTIDLPQENNVLWKSPSYLYKILKGQNFLSGFKRAIPLFSVEKDVM